MSVILEASGSANPIKIDRHEGQSLEALRGDL
jgi:hypothetical protein